MKFCIVILNYETLEDTIRCVESISKQNYFKIGNVDIVIVDNASSNDSGKILKEKFAGNLNIYILLLDENLGFAKGNNIGFKYANERLKSDFIILSNSDIEITQEFFFESIIETYNRTHFSLFGPDIRKKEGSEYIHQNPKSSGIKVNRKFLKKEIRKFDLQTRRSLTFDNLSRIKLIKKIRESLRNNKYIKTITPKYFLCDEGLLLYGAFLVFSKNYIEKYPEGLFDKTFMYAEEYALTYQLQKENLIQVYDPSVYVNHLEGSATLNSRSQNQRTKFLRKEGLKSLNEILNYVED